MTRVYLLAVHKPIIKWKNDVYEYKTKKERDKAIQALTLLKSPRPKIEWATTEAEKNDAKTIG